MVVIAIIGLLASVILAAVQIGREKAKNASKNLSIDQYTKAALIYASNNNSYPYAGISQFDNFQTRYCLGYSSNETCFGSFYSTFFAADTSSLNNAFKTYLPGPPANRGTLITSGADASAVVYTCLSVDASAHCTQYALEWGLSGVNQSCGVGQAGYLPQDVMWSFLIGPSYVPSASATSCYYISDSI